MTPEQIYEKYHRLAWKVARIMQRTYHLTEEDVEDITMAALTRFSAIPMDKIDARGHAGYIRTVINNAARTELKLVLKRRTMLHYEDEFDEDSDTARPVTETTSPIESNLIDSNLLSFYRSTLTSEEAEIIDLMLGSETQPPMDQRQIASRLGTTQKHLQQVLNRTYIRARKRLEK